jgi:hypothetical protein
MSRKRCQEPFLCEQRPMIVASSRTAARCMARMAR